MVGQSNVIYNHIPSQLQSYEPICSDMMPINVISEWRDGEPDLMLDPTIWPPSFDLSRQFWSMLNQFQTG